MYDYYIGETDANKNYQIVSNKANNKISVNMIKRFIREEIAYLLGNPLTYISRSGDKKIINTIKKNLAHWSEKHDQNLLKKSLIYGNAYELYYKNSEGLFSSMILSPLECYVYENDNGVIEFALRIFNKRFDNAQYMDVYAANEIYHYKVAYRKFELLGEPTKHGFKRVPISQCPIAEEKEHDTLFKDIKGLQDAYETNLSDSSNELSDFRTALLKIVGGQLKEEDLPRLKKLGIIQSDESSTDIDWLIKNINDQFIQNTLKTLKENMFTISNHIDDGQALASNISSLTLRNRLINLENKCKINGDALTDCIKNRLKFLFIYLDGLELNSTGFDYRDIEIKYVLSIPNDDLLMSQISSQLGISELFSKKTMRSQFSFCDNPDAEEKLIKEENKDNEIGKRLLDDAGDDDGSTTE